MDGMQEKIRLDYMEQIQTQQAFYLFIEHRFEESMQLFAELKTGTDPCSVCMSNITSISNITYIKNITSISYHRYAIALDCNFTGICISFTGV